LTVAYRIYIRGWPEVYSMATQIWNIRNIYRHGWFFVPYFDYITFWHNRGTETVKHSLCFLLLESSVYSCYIFVFESLTKVYCTIFRKGWKAKRLKGVVRMNFKHFSSQMGIRRVCWKSIQKYQEFLVNYRLDVLFVKDFVVV
jgi:hypothetical protein